MLTLPFLLGPAQEPLDVGAASRLQPKVSVHFKTGLPYFDVICIDF